LNIEGLSDPKTWSNFIQDEKFETNLDIKISKNGRDLCAVTGSNPNFTISSIADDEKLYHSYLISGLVDWFFSFSEAKTPGTAIESINLEGDISTWFSNHLNNKILVIDTNIILDRIFSSLKFLGYDFLNNINIRIPRLGILELERITNHGSDLKKKKGRLGYVELMYLKDNGARSMNELDIETLTGFSNIAEDQDTDSWIRREIRDSRRRDLRARVVTKYVLITGDLVNSFSAIAEDIDTIYVSKINDWQNKIRNPNLEQIGRLIITLAVLCGNITVNINSKQYELRGMWEGKTMWNWNQEQAYFKEIV